MPARPQSCQYMYSFEITLPSRLLEIQWRHLDCDTLVGFYYTSESCLPFRNGCTTLTVPVGPMVIYSI
jgi:hypothetical protein